MAKVMISIPDEQLAEADRRASGRGTTRSGYLQSLIQGDIEASDEAARAALGRILALAEPHGGNVVELIKQNRPKH